MESKRQGNLKRERKWIITILVVVISISSILILARQAVAEQVGPDVTLVGSSTHQDAGNATINQSGRYIHTYTFTSVEKNPRWKAYVGNVSAGLVLQNSDQFSVYEWDLGTVRGEVYATRNATTIDWSNLNCTWAAGSGVGDRSVEDFESAQLSHTGSDSLNMTFTNRTHPAVDLGVVSLPENYCYSLYPYVNNTDQDYLGQSKFPELIMFDGDSPGDGAVVYVGIIENDQYGYRNDSTYDFQMMVPENGASGFSGSTAYYFYVEIA